MVEGKTPFVVRSSRRRQKKPALAVMTPPLITQRDLIEESLLRQEAREAARVHREKREEIRRALEAGAKVEQGIRTVEIRARRAMLLR